ncbi:MAG: 50S ribosome-binding GTPase [Nanoarchaeota archaeon]|nr:50S ribosome-binding GTPase [Nanoarchaeota archaeon]MBU0962424.1 50S ribosome-binding GTPase [Nanoarchaeota archaeon]
MAAKFTDFIANLFSIFRKKKSVKLGLYGPPNSGKSSLANKICEDWIGEPLSSVSQVPHETREVKQKEKVVIKSGKKSLTFNIVDTPGIATKIDYTDFLKFKMKSRQAKKRAMEATKGVIESIKWLDNMDAVVVVLDSTKNPFSQVNLTIMGNLAARKTPVLVVGNKIDLKKADIKKIQSAFPQYNVVGISALKGTNIDDFYKSLFRLVR